MKLGDMIREYRAEHKYSLREFADICDISFAQVRLMERGLNSDGKPFIPTIATLKKLATGMGITFNELVSISDDLTDVMTPGLWPRSEDKKRSRPTTSSSPMQHTMTITLHLDNIIIWLDCQAQFPS